jgi:DSBA-like thioredoxin domain
MADLEFFFDPVCPFAWITSRWVTEVQQQRDYDVRWRFIALAVLNEAQTGDWYTPEYRAGHMAGMKSLRVADQVRLTQDNDAVARLYTALGNGFHVARQMGSFREDPLAFIEAALVEAGLDPRLAEHADDEAHDEHIRAETTLALERTGGNVGTPIITFKPETDSSSSFFGPVISKAPRGEDALKLWDAIETIATSSTMSELKRSNRAKLDFT